MQELKQHALEEGYDSESSYVREALKEKMRRGDFERKLEQRLLASLNEQSKRIRSLDQGQRLAFSAFTAFAKLFLLYFPEPSSMILRDTGAGRIYLRRQPRTKQEAVRWAQELDASGITVSVGLLQVNTERGGHSVEELLDPCTNLKLGWNIFAAAYRQEVRLIGPGQRALLTALAAYNAGSPRGGFRNGYVFSVMRKAY